jgi:hypothetical protein
MRYTVIEHHPSAMEKRFRPRQGGILKPFVVWDTVENRIQGEKRHSTWSGAQARADRLNAKES